MPRRLSSPTTVPDGHEQLIKMLWRFYVAADGPSTKRIAAVIASQDEDVRKATANHETVRRTLLAIYLPELLTVEVIFLALCEIADIDPDDEDDEDDERRWGGPRSHRDRLRQCYRLARYGTSDDLPRTRSEKARQEAAAREHQQGTSPDDPWGAPPPRGSGGFADEPPF